MSDDIETLKQFLNGLSPSLYKRDEALAAFERIVAERDSLRKALDDRWEADKRAAKAILEATGKTRGLPPVKEVVAFYMAEAERLEKERATIFDEAIEWRDMAQATRAKLERAKEVLSASADTCHAIGHALANDGYVQANTIWQHERQFRAVLSELSAAPAQQTQISDEAAREAMVEAEKALAGIVADIRDYEQVNNLSPSPGKKDCWQSVTHADATLAKLRSVMK